MIDEYEISKVNKLNRRLAAENVLLKSTLAAMDSELSLVDAALARRPALEKYSTRYEKICAACAAAGRAEPKILMTVGGTEGIKHGKET